MTPYGKSKRGEKGEGVTSFGRIKGGGGWMGGGWVGVVVVEECDVLWNKEEVERKGKVTPLTGNSLEYFTDTARKCAMEK